MFNVNEMQQQRPLPSTRRTFASHPHDTDDGSSLGYLMSQYPMRSHTFVRREIEALRRRGLSIRVFSIRPSPHEAGNSDSYSAAFQETCYLLPTNIVTLLSVHGRALLSRPMSYVRVFSLALRHRVPGVRALVWAVFHFAEAILLAHELERCRVRHLHNHLANAGATIGLLASRFLQLPWSLTLHGISETDYPAGPLLGYKIKAAHFVACASYFMRAQAMRSVSPEHWHKIVVVRCGLNLADLPQPDTSRRRHGLRVTSVGRLFAEKGHLGLLEAFAMLRRRGIDAFLTIVGDGPERARIQEAIRGFGLHEHVALLGSLGEEETLQQIASSDILVVSSFMEGLPIVLMEAMAMGVPVVAPRLAGVPELVAEEQHGLLFCPSDWNDLAEKMARLLVDQALRSRLGEAGRVRVDPEFDISCAVEPLVTLFARDCAARHHRSGSRVDDRGCTRDNR